MTIDRVSVKPFRLGEGVCSVELLLETRTAVEDALPEIAAGLQRGLNIANEVSVRSVIGGSAPINDPVRLLAEAASGCLGALVVARHTAVLLADLIVGGSGVGEDRPATDLELRLISARLLAMVSPVVNAVAPGHPPATGLVSGEYSVPSRSLVVELETHIEGAAVALYVEVLPQRLDDNDAGDVVNWPDVPLDVTFSFTPVRLHAGDVAALEPGDVICLEHEQGAPVVGQVSGRPLLQGRIGVSRRHVAVEIVNLLEEAQ